MEKPAEVKEYLGERWWFLILALVVFYFEPDWASVGFLAYMFSFALLARFLVFRRPLGLAAVAMIAIGMALAWYFILRDRGLGAMPGTISGFVGVLGCIRTLHFGKAKGDIVAARARLGDPEALAEQNRWATGLPTWWLKLLAANLVLFAFSKWSSHESKARLSEGPIGFSYKTTFQRSLESFAEGNPGAGAELLLYALPEVLSSVIFVLPPALYYWIKSVRHGNGSAARRWALCAIGLIVGALALAVLFPY